MASSIVKKKPLNQAVELIASFEGCSLIPYKDVAGVWTIGYGFTHDLIGNPITQYTKPLTQDEADAMLWQIVKPYADGVVAYVHPTLTENQYAACVSLAYNIGLEAFRTSTVCREINLGNFQKAADAFLLWNKAGGKIVQGLVNRRKKEREIFLT